MNIMRTKHEYVLTFEEFHKGNPNIHSNFQKFPPQDPDYDDRPEDKWDDEDESENEEE